MNIKNLNQFLKQMGLKEFPLNFAEKLNNKKINIELFKQTNHKGFNPLIIILSNNKNQDLGFKNNEILDLINLYPEQLLHVNKYGCNPLIYILNYNKGEELGLTSKNIIDLINKYPEQLLQIDKDGLNPLMLILANNKTQKLGFSFEYINNIYEKQINKKYNYIGYNNRKHTILFNEEYILNKLNFLNCEVTFYQEFLDYRKALLEKQKINNNFNNNTSIFSSNISKI